MKKLIALLLTLVMAVAVAITAVGCKKDNDVTVNVYMPDGAPALAFSKLMHEDNQLGVKEVNYTVVDASAIATYVANSSADVALMPINAAAKLCSTGENYKMVSVNTHGNLFVIGKGDATVLSDLVGKKVAVVNLPAVPGLTFKALLKKAGIPFVEGNAATPDKVTLANAAGTEVAALIKTNKCDYAVAPQPAVSVITSNAQIGAKVNMSLQTLWGEGGYPQAVLMVKTSLANDKKFVNTLLTALDGASDWVKANTADAVAAISAHMAEGTTTTLDANKLPAAAIDGSNIKVVKAADAKDAVNSYLASVLEIAPNSTKAVTDAFFA